MCDGAQLGRVRHVPPLVGDAVLSGFLAVVAPAVLTVPRSGLLLTATSIMHERPRHVNSRERPGMPHDGLSFL